MSKSFWSWSPFSSGSPVSEKVEDAPMLSPAVGASLGSVPSGGDAVTPSASSSGAASTPVEKGGLKPPPVDPSAPIQFENYAREYMGIAQQDTFDGFRIEAAKPVNKYMTALHSLILGTNSRECGYAYNFGPSFTTDDGRLQVLSRMGTDGTVSTRVASKLTENTETRLGITSSLKEPEANTFEASTDIVSKDWATSLKCAWQGTWLLSGSFSQVIAPRLQLGADLTWIAANGGSIGVVGARYAANDYVTSVAVSRQPDFKNPMANFMSNCYISRSQFFRKVSDRLSLGAELEYTHPTQESSLRLGYEYTFRQARIQGLIDTCGRVSMFTQEGTTGLGLSGSADFWKNEYKFGLMLQLVPPPETPPTAAPS